MDKRRPCLDYRSAEEETLWALRVNYELEIELLGITLSTGGLVKRAVALDFQHLVK